MIAINLRPISQHIKTRWTSHFWQKGRQVDFIGIQDLKSSGIQVAKCRKGHPEVFNQLSMINEQSLMVSQLLTSQSSQALGSGPFIKYALNMQCISFKDKARSFIPTEILQIFQWA